MSSYSSPVGHRTMIFDERRNAYYARAIKRAVDKDSVVLDLGAGLGLHGMMAVNAGAQKAYLVEPTSVLDVARQLVTENDLSAQIECVSGLIEEVELPEQVDLIISVLTGNFLLTEDLLPSLFFARDKYLAPGGRLIPDRATMNVVPVSAAEYYARHIDCWNTASQDVNLGRVRNYAANTLFYDTAKYRDAAFLSAPAELLEMDFMTATEASCRSKTKVELSETELCHGWLGWFRARLGEKWLSTSPIESKTHWSQVFLPLETPVPVKKGEAMTFELNRPERGEWSWVVEYGGQAQRLSTFRSEPVTRSSLLKKSDYYKSHISDRGNVALEVLSKLNGAKTTSAIVAFVLENHGTLFPTQKLADKFVKELINKYGL